MERSTERAGEREVFGGPIGENQGVQFPIARAYAGVEAASLMVEKAASLFDRNEPCGAEANLAKLLAADASWEAANVAVQTFGDLKQKDSREVLNSLLEKADVFVQNLAPGATRRLGFGTDDLRKRHPKLIVCDVSGYGASGPYRDKKAYDLLVQCEAALVSVTGTPETPSKAGIAVADIAAGMYAYSGILAALFRRERTGEGAAIEVSLFEALAEWMGFPAYYAMYGDKEPPRSGASHASIAPYGPFACAESEVVFLGIQNEREWEKFCEVVLERTELMEDARFSTNSERLANREALDREIERTFGRLSAEEAIEKLEGAGIANARLRSVREFLDHPQLRARDRWREVDSPAGPLHALLPPGLPADAEPVMNPIPEVGQHTASILAELGFDEDALGG